VLTVFLNVDKYSSCWITGRKDSIYFPECMEKKVSDMWKEKKTRSLYRPSLLCGCIKEEKAKNVFGDKWGTKKCSSPQRNRQGDGEESGYERIAQYDLRTACKLSLIHI